MKKNFALLMGFALILFLLADIQAKPKKEGRPGPREHYKMMDTDNDGKISLAEWQAAHTEMFKQKDTNDDGYLTEDELRPQKGKKPPKGQRPDNRKKSAPPANPDDNDKPGM